METRDSMPVRKPGKDPTLINNFRSISFFPTLGKVFEMVIPLKLHQLTRLRPEQHCFREKHETIYHLLKLVEAAGEARNTNNIIPVIFQQRHPLYGVRDSTPVHGQPLMQQEAKE